VLLTVLFSQPVPPDIDVKLTVTQIGAEKYGAPQLYLGN
jgi:hypothetical protein